MDSKEFEVLSPSKLFLRCSIPAMISMAAGCLYQIVDGIFVGRFIGEGALAAVNLIMPIVMIVFALSNMIATGASVRISILLGVGDRETASKTFSFVLGIIAGLSIITGVIGVVAAEPIVRFFANGATEEAIKHGIIYLRLYAAFNPFMLPFFATDNFLRICGKEKLSMWINVATQVLNISLDIILIGAFHQGVWAAAFSSCISMTLGSVITLALFVGKRFDLYYVKGIIEKSQFFRIIVNGFSEFFSNTAMSVTSVVFNYYLLKYGGTTAVAAFSVLMYVDSFVGMLIFGMCDSMQPPISHCYGACLNEKVKALFKLVLLAGSGLSFVSFLFMMFAGKLVAPFFIEPGDTELLEMSLGAMKLFAISYLVGWIDMVLSSYFTALEMPRQSLILSFLGTLVFPIISIAAMAKLWGLNGVWLSQAVSGTLVSIVAIILLKTKGKTKDDVE